MSTELPARPKSKVLIVDDHPLVREGLAARIGAQPDLEACGEASDVGEAWRLIGAMRPALVIVDLTLGNGSGLDLIRKVKGAGAGPKILVVSAYDETLFAERVLRAGAHGYVNKQEMQGSIIEAIHAVLRGELYFSAAISQRLAQRAIAGPTARHGVEALTDREMQVFILIGKGHSTRAIGEQLHLSVHTIETHREKIRTKLDLPTGSALVRQAVQWVLENTG